MTEQGPARPVRVLLADDQPLLRAGFRTVLTGDGFDVVGEVGDGSAAVELTRRLLPDVVVMRLRMPRLDGVAATRAIVTAGFPVRVLVLAGQGDDEEAVNALRAGASGVLAEESAGADLIRTIRTVTGGGAVLTPPLLRLLLGSFHNHRPGPVPTEFAGVLTSREREVLTQLARGLSNAEISETLSVGETTVKTHVGRILAKLGLRDRVQAVVLAYESGLVDPAPSRPVIARSRRFPEWDGG